MPASPKTNASPQSILGKTTRLVADSDLSHASRFCVGRSRVLPADSDKFVGDVIGPGLLVVGCDRRLHGLIGLDDFFLFRGFRRVGKGAAWIFAVGRSRRAFPPAAAC